MHRFFIPAESLSGAPIVLPAEVAHQVFRVLRLRARDRIVLFCGDGEECEAGLESVGPTGATARILERRRPEVELRCRLHVAVAVLKGEKPDWTLQKLTELGAARISLIQTERCVAGGGEERWPKRLERYARIAREAAEQCGRVRLPELRGPRTLAEVLEEEPGALRLFLEPGSPLALSDALGSPRESVLLLIGPEGGFTPTEVEQARSSGALVVSLGRRILRAETAAITAAAVVMAALESGGEDRRVGR